MQNIGEAIADGSWVIRCSECNGANFELLPGPRASRCRKCGKFLQNSIKQSYQRLKREEQWSRGIHDINPMHYYN